MDQAARKKPYISEKNRKERIAFAKEHVHWTSEQWSKVIFTDKSKFNRLYSDEETYMGHCVEEESKNICTKSTVKDGEDFILVWGAMSINGTSPIYRIEETMSRHIYLNILKNVLLPYASNQMPNDWIYQANNDSIHIARKVKRFIKNQNIKKMKWPSQSSDLNPIKMLWTDVDKFVKQQKPKNLEELYTVIQDGWKSISKERCIQLIQSMPQKCSDVIKQEGLPITY